MNNEEKILKILESMQSQINENTQILKALEHSSEEHKALLDQLNHRTASVEGKIETLTSKVDTISKDLTMVEAVAGKNMTDIAYLKGVR